MANNNCLVSADGEKEYEYYAFISYKREDKKWAKWIQRSIEGYSIPVKLCSEQGIPKHVTPIFRDETDLTGGDTVTEKLVENLNKCKYLIVICTKHMQKEAEWIDLEIEQFLALGNSSSHILPVIIDGIACSEDPAEECMPPAILKMGDNQPLGITLKGSKKKDVILKLVASMLELSLTSLKSHEHERVQRRRVRILTSISVAMLLFSGFMYNQYLQINRAKMNVENTNAYISLQDGDKLRSQEMAQSVKDNTMMLNRDIHEQAERISILSSIHTKYMPVTVVGDKNANLNKMFTNDGEAILLYDENDVYKYNLQGKMLWRFSGYQYGVAINDVSSDGIHCVLATVDDKTTLWLYNMETGEKMTELVSSDAYDNSEKAKGSFLNVVDAQFSPDGETVTACRTGGYYNTNDRLCVWDSKTGEEIISMDGEILGTREEGGNQGEIVEEFEYISDHMLHWKGSVYHVFCDIEKKEAYRVPLRDWVEYESISAWVAYDRYGIMENDSEYMVYDVATDLFGSWNLAEGEAVVKDRITCFSKDNNQVAIPIMNSKGNISNIQIVALETMQLIEECQISESRITGGYNQVYIKTIPGSDDIYFILTGKNKEQFLKYSAVDNLFTEITIEEKAFYSENVRFIGYNNNADIMIVEKDNKVFLGEIGKESVEYYTIDEAFSSFAASVQISPENGENMMALHNNSIYLYSAEYPGTALESEFAYEDGVDILHEVSEDGRTIVKAQKNHLDIWVDGSRVDTDTLLSDANILDMDLTEDGSILLVATAREIVLYKKDNTGYHIMTSKETGAQFVKMIEKENRIITLTSWRGYSERKWNQPYYELSLLEGDTLNTIYEQDNAIYCEENYPASRYVTISPDGKQYAGIEMYPINDGDNYVRTITVRSVQTGKILAETFASIVNDNPADELNNIEELDTYQLVDETNLISFSYVSYADTNTLLAGWSSGVWLFDTEKFRTVCYIKEASSLTGLPLMLKSGLLLYPADEIHIWDTQKKKIVQNLNVCLSDSERAQRINDQAGNMYLSADNKWLFVADTEQTKIYRTDDWSLCGWLSSNPVCCLFMDEQSIIYDTGREIYTIKIKENER